ncbi:MAG: DUF192 domain-containing protein [Richelia sp. RM1_1_1]|nr:DUF192 domain-containing protein [Richelia sp. RM1_1_1]
MKITQLKKPISPEDIFLKSLNIVGPIAALLLASLPIALHFYGRKPQKLPVSASFTKNNQTVQLEVARKRIELYYGLKFRKSIPENRGMLFVVNRVEPIRLWMKDTYIPLDIIFMRDGVVNDIVTNATPCKEQPCPAYGGRFPANQIIEIPAGKASKLGIKVGDKITIIAEIPK